jgi:Peptidase M1 N-terminal domain
MSVLTLRRQVSHFLPPSATTAYSTYLLNINNILQFPSSLRFFAHRTMATQSHPQREILPTNVIPKHYKLSLTPDFSTFKFAGKLAVDLHVKEPTSSIILNALDLELHSASINTNGKQISSKTISLDEEKQIATLDFEDELKVAKDSIVLNIDFTGILNDKMCGFYRSSYIDTKTGEKKWLATTQMGISFYIVINKNLLMLVVHFPVGYYIVVHSNIG